MIANGDPAAPPVFYGIWIVEIAAISEPNNWFWCPGPLNPADLLTRTGSTCAQIKSDFWLHGSFLPQPKSSYPIKECTSLLSDSLPRSWINLTIATPVNASSDLIINLLEHSQSLSKVISALFLIHKRCRTWRKDPNPAQTWISVKNSISSSIIKCFSTETEALIATNKLKHLVIQPRDGVYHVSVRSFRSKIVVSLICKKTILAKCILQDTHVALGHG